MLVQNRDKRREWQRRAARKHAVVPRYFEVTPTYAVIHCGKCTVVFQRNLIMNVNEPTFICPNPACKARNWLPVRYQMQH